MGGGVVVVGGGFACSRMARVCGFEVEVLSCGSDMAGGGCFESSRGGHMVNGSVGSRDAESYLSSSLDEDEGVRRSFVPHLPVSLSGDNAAQT
jgi:hypothetical protein